MLRILFLSLLASALVNGGIVSDEECPPFCKDPLLNKAESEFCPEKCRPGTEKIGYFEKCLKDCVSKNPEASKLCEISCQLSSPVVIDKADQGGEEEKKDERVVPKTAGMPKEGEVQLDRGEVPKEGEVQLDKGEVQLDKGEVQLDKGEVQLDRGEGDEGFGEALASSLMKVHAYMSNIMGHMVDGVQHQKMYGWVGVPRVWPVEGMVDEADQEDNGLQIRVRKVGVPPVGDASIIPVGGAKIDVTGAKMGVTGAKMDVRGAKMDVGGGAKMGVTGAKMGVTGAKMDVTGAKMDVTGAKMDVTGAKQGTSEDGGFQVHRLIIIRRVPFFTFLRPQHGEERVGGETHHLPAFVETHQATVLSRKECRWRRSLLLLFSCVFFMLTAWYCAVRLVARRTRWIQESMMKAASDDFDYLIPIEEKELLKADLSIIDQTPPPPYKPVPVHDI